MPTAVLPVRHLLLRATLFDAAGVDAPPTTIDDLETVDDALKASGHRPDRGRRQGRLARRALVLQLRAARLRARTTMNEAAVSREFDDPCWLEAGENLQAFLDTEPFNDGLPHDRRPAGRRLVRGPRGQPPGGDGAHGRLGPRA